MIIFTNKINSIFSKTKIIKTKIKSKYKTIQTIKILCFWIKSKITLIPIKVFSFLKFLKIKNKLF